MLHPVIYGGRTSHYGESAFRGLQAILTNPFSIGCEVISAKQLSIRLTPKGHRIDRGGVDLPKTEEATPAAGG